MEFSELIQKRYSVRAYHDRPVPEEILEKILEAAVIAPTGANRQPFQILVVRTENRKENLKKIYGPDWFIQAPIVLCICTVPEQAWSRQRFDGKNLAEVDASIVMTHIILAAADAGLGTCWIAAFDPDAAKKVLKLPAGIEPLAFTPLGYPADQWQPKKRKSMDTLVRYLD